MTIEASLRRLHLSSPAPEKLAAFYSANYGLTARETEAAWLCTAPGRALAVSHGPANQLRHALFAFGSDTAWQRFRERTASLPQVPLDAEPLLPQGAVGFRDPDGNLIVFARMPHEDHAPVAADGLSAELQHFALRTRDVPAMLAFYQGLLGFTLSDQVRDAEGTLRACFLRVNHLHHALALFGAPVCCFDHQSFETADWQHLKAWADDMASRRTSIVWGIGRHGPGNDVFFMVRDPDGNLAEISSEIETCAEDRPAGLWPHEERTLNLWGQAIMRS